MTIFEEVMIANVGNYRKNSDKYLFANEQNYVINHE